MAAESEGRIGGTYLGGTPKRIGDHQALLFNASDFIAIGEMGGSAFSGPTKSPFASFAAGSKLWDA